MAVKVVTQVAINEKPEAVFQYLCDLSYHFLWNPRMLTINPSSGKLKDGYKYTTTSMVLGVRVKSANTITKFVPDKEIQIENSTGLVHYQANFGLRARSKETLVVCSISLTATSNAFAFTTPVLRMLARRELLSDLNFLKIAVEQKLK